MFSSVASTMNKMLCLIIQLQPFIFLSSHLAKVDKTFHFFKIGKIGSDNWYNI